MNTLHVTNGDAVGGSLMKAGLGDAVLPWRDVLHDGPVPGGLDAAALRIVRATFLASRGWSTFDTALADFAGRDAQLGATGAGDTVVLWFEPDLYDQLQLLQILTRFYLRPLRDRPTITIVASDQLLGPLAIDTLAKYGDTQRAVREVDLELAASGWEAFTSSDTEMLRAFAGHETALFSAPNYASDSAVVLPHVHAAMRRLLEEYPSTTNGVSRTEQQTLSALLSGPRSVAKLYEAAHAPNETMAWLGDWSFAWYVEQMMLAGTPLIACADGSDMIAGLTQSDSDRFWKQPVQLTAAGREVATDQANAILLNGIDRWIGGVHLLSPLRDTIN
ncbi:MAG: hypothetical protein H7Z40_07430 [Phycisphaerae bacterium]|nr:hypothetical protein [Gemmatimonadaceae bacterium]